jgi:ribosomal protein S18 acetylase RimI-like enzyme
MTEIAKTQPPDPYLNATIIIRPLADGDAPALLKLYNYRNEQSRRTFRGLGGKTTDLSACEKVVAETGAGGENIDFVAVDAESAFVGWSFVWRLDQEDNVFGLLVADHMQGRGLGRKLAAAALTETDRRGIPVVHLTVVTDNARAIGLYRSLGFIEAGSFCGSDGLDYYRMQRRRMEDAPN